MVSLRRSISARRRAPGLHAKPFDPGWLCGRLVGV